MLSAAFKKLGPQQPVPPPPPYKLPMLSPTGPNMPFNKNKLAETPLFEQSEPMQEPIQSRTSPDDFVMQAETSDQAFKRIETTRLQMFYRQSAVDSARAADMDDIHHGPAPAMHPPGASCFADNNNDYFMGWDFPDFDCGLYNDTVTSSSELAQSTSGDTLVAQSFVPGSIATANTSYYGSAGSVDTLASASSVATGPSYFGDAALFGPASSITDEHTHYDIGHASASASPAFGIGEINRVGAAYLDLDQEVAQDNYTVSATPAYDSEFMASESEDEPPRKAPKLNKDGAPRKPRQPRAKLLKWTDDDWKNVCLGIVWACGETGVQIPFEQAAQVVGEKCTAGALQQALLKLRGKQIAEGYQIPNLKMAWTRKNRHAALGAKSKSYQEPEADRPRKKPTRVEATQALLVSVPRAYNDEARSGMARPYKWKKPSRNARSSMPQGSANVKKEETAAPFTGTRAGGAPEHVFNSQAPQDGYLPATPMTGRHRYTSQSVTPLGNNTGGLQGMDIGGGEYAHLLTTDGIYDLGSGFADATDDVFSI
ncbi:hypothetical protein OPT61_g5170 [Boeremia exigua]|uniref:Uncharacterized protein n=1 Tax=Boeremia exigua TaxID=749465 RepID=A0ACC2IB96_9PLEO|nr:hypothetical protein OPT61_g5170 [Boeremia exigua]